MTRIQLIALALTGALLSGCGYSEDAFAEDLWNVNCDLAFDCLTQDEIDAAVAGGFWIFGASKAECNNLADDLLVDEDDTCEFDAAAGKQCISEARDSTCEEFLAGTTPASCSDVCE